MKKQSNFYMKYIAIISLCLLIVGGYFAITTLRSQDKLDIVGVDKDNPYYSLRKNATAYQKEIYKEISAELKKDTVDQSKVSGLVVQNYIADFYTWTNKLRFNDVGGLQYLHKDIQGWVNVQAMETFYGDMAYYIENGGLENTLEVKSVSVTVEKSTFIPDEDDEEAAEVLSYRVLAKWNYVNSTKLDVSEFQNEAIFTLIEDSEGLFSIVEVQDVQEQ